MTRPKIRDIDMIGRVRPEPKPDEVRSFQWRELNNAFGHINRAQFEYERGNYEDGLMWLDDVRRCLGALALSMADGPAAEGYARLFEAVTEPERKK